MSLSPLPDLTSDSIAEKPGSLIYIITDPAQFSERDLCLFEANRFLVQLRASTVELSVASFLIVAENFRSGTSEDSLHARTDAFGRIMMDACRGAGGMSLSCERNKVAGSTRSLSRPDAFFFFPGKPVVVLVEEKDGTSYSIDDAVRDLVSKFELTPAYGSLAYIAGVAVAGNTLQILQLRGGGRHELLARHDLGDMVGRVACMVSFLNLGRWCKSIAERSHALHAIALQYGKRYRDADNRNEITVGFHQVVKTYFNLPPRRADELKEFYIQTRSVRNVEHSTDFKQGSPNNEGRVSLTLTLFPVGLPLPNGPDTIEETIAALQCIVNTLCAIHALEWCPLDLRWPNVVRTRASHGGYRFFLIDCEYATRTGGAIPAPIQHLEALSQASTASFQCDWRMVAHMCRVVQARLNDDRLLSFCDFLETCDSDVGLDAIKAQTLFSGADWTSL
jgi:hypothetical protein